MADARRRRSPAEVAEIMKRIQWLADHPAEMRKINKKAREAPPLTAEPIRRQVSWDRNQRRHGTGSLFRAA